MATDSDAIRVGTSGRVYVAPIGSTLPTNALTALDAAFKDLGYLTEDGVSFDTSMDVNEIRAWQSFYTVKRIVTGRGFELTFTMLERNALTFALAFGGGTITETAVDSGQWKYTPAGPDELDERSFVVEVVENDIVDRYVIPRGLVTDLGSVSARRTDATMFEVTVAALADDNGDPYILYSSDPAMEPA